MKPQEIIEKLASEYKEFNCDIPQFCIVDNRVYMFLRYMFTWGFCYGVDEHFIEGRYCYPNKFDGLEAFDLFEQQGYDTKSYINETSAPYGNWLKHKGRIEFSNPNYDNK